MCKNPFETLEQAKQLGIHTILTSGQKNNCVEGTELLAKLVEKAEGKLDILIAGGVDGNIISNLYKETGSHTYHMSGKVTLDSEMKYRKEDVSRQNQNGKGNFRIIIKNTAQSRRLSSIFVQGMRESNPHQKFWRLLSYHLTNPLCRVFST